MPQYFSGYLVNSKNLLILFFIKHIEEYPMDTQTGLPSRLAFLKAYRSHALPIYLVITFGLCMFFKSLQSPLFRR
jgi:hypothetical protein